MAHLTVDEFNQFNSELASLVRAGIPLPEGLKEVAHSMKSSRLRTFTTEVAENLSRGESITTAVEKASVSVRPEYAALLRCADQSGDTKTFMDFSVQHARRIQRHRLAVSASIGYPLFIVVVAFGILIFMAFNVLPMFTDMFIQLGAELPALTQLTHALMAPLASPFALLLFALAVIALPLLVFFDRLRDRLLDGAAVVPGFARLISLSDASVCMRFVGVMLSKGIPLSDALHAASLAVTTRRASRALLAMKERADQGLPVAELLPETMPATAKYLFKSAEEKGNLPNACIGISEYCENQFDILSRRSMTFFEPLLILIVGLMVGIIIVANYLPLFSIPKVVG